MSQQPFRTPSGGAIDRSKPLNFKFNGKPYTGYQGDTLASALLANGVKLVGRSFKYHRPRGIMTAGVEEPNALVQLRTGNRTEPNIRCTQAELFDGLEATSQNCWPSVDFDVNALNNLLSPLFPAGFYNKTFMWPASWWMRYEHRIRKIAGLGVAPTEPDPDRYAKRFAHCEVLVVGGGPAGLMAALSAGKSGARTILIDDNAILGGALRDSAETLNGESAVLWVAAVKQQLVQMENVRILTRTTAFGYYDDNLLLACERVGDHLHRLEPGQPRQRIWWIRANQVVLATGSIERPIVFGNNDLPGVMLSSAVRSYARQHGVRCGDKAVVMTNNDSAYHTIPALIESGGKVLAIVDSRTGPGKAALDVANQHEVEVISDAVVVNANGRKCLTSVAVNSYAKGELGHDEIGNQSRTIECDLLAVSGGWNPTVHLFSQSQGKLRYDDNLTCFVPHTSVRPQMMAGSVNGEFATRNCLTEGANAGRLAAEKAGFMPGEFVPLPTCDKIIESPIQACWVIPVANAKKSKPAAKQFIDFQNDVTSSDVALAHREGYQSVEHLKRYTTLGMGTDQGRTSNVNGLAMMAQLSGRSIPEVGATTFRPPFSAISMGAIASNETGENFMPLRRTPMHEWHVENGATMVNVGAWQRAQHYQRPGETMMEAIYREGKQVRAKVGIVDVSTLGTIALRGRDVAEFLNRVYINKWMKLPVGKARYGLMLREDGHVADDGTTTRISENEYYMTTTTASAGPVMSHLEFYAQTVWPELNVHITSITDQWGGMALAGPDSRKVLEKAVDEGDVGNDSIGFMGYKAAAIDGYPVRIFRITFSGELAYEIHVASDYALSVWEAFMRVGKAFDITPYGTEALSMLRIEKGHIVGGELDGRTTAADFGFGGMQKTDEDFIGKRALDRPGMVCDSRKILVGLISENGEEIKRGSQLIEKRPIEKPGDTPPVKMLGHVSSKYYSANLQQHIGLGLLEKGQQWMGKTIYAASPLTDTYVPVKVVHPVFIDPEGGRARG
ncbi:sarcosine oxidase subunit alpha family protein [Candidatus Spongiihabitans sp.]|uniref:sarcosine oxidase subunit alpha family protein n=1 Tax=Candidatus Spongiihabitans sp. TaxID=3101308 RepID=UPI003C6F6F74